MLIGGGGAASFPDVNGHWARTYVDYLCARGVLNGMKDSAGILQTLLMHLI